MPPNPNEVIRQCIGVLDRIINDDSVPRNIRRNAERMKKTLSNEKDPPSTRVAMVVSKLDDIGNAPNVPLHSYQNTYLGHIQSTGNNPRR